MVGRRKTTPEVLDKIVQFVWDYQDKHNGDTPTIEAIGRHVGFSGQSGGYFIGLLIDDGRFNKISSRPFRVTIADHPMNKSAISRWKRIRDQIERDEAAERDRIRQEQDKAAQGEQLQQDKQALFSAMTTEPGHPLVPASLSPQPQQALDFAGPAVERFNDTRKAMREAQSGVKAAMPQLLKLADERDLVFEVVQRGYSVQRAR